MAAMPPDPRLAVVPVPVRLNHVSMVNVLTPRVLVAWVRLMWFEPLNWTPVWADTGRAAAAESRTASARVRVRRRPGCECRKLSIIQAPGTTESGREGLDKTVIIAGHGRRWDPKILPARAGPWAATRHRGGALCTRNERRARRPAPRDRTASSYSASGTVAVTR